MSRLKTFGAMTMYKISPTKQSKRDGKAAKANGFKDRIDEIFKTVQHDPYEPVPGHYFEKLVGYKNDTYSRHINYHHRFIYEILPNAEGLRNEKGELYKGIVRVLRVWAHDYRKK
jgi:Txe/YoeB family toxin of toxin-antitoxin system